MTEFSIREAVEMAVQTERLGYDFYSAMAEKHRDEKDLKELFSTLASKEQAHEKVFEELKGRIGDSEPAEWNEVAPYMRAIVESAFFLGKEKAAMHIQNIRDLQGALGFAIAFEKETLLFFYGIRDGVSDTELIDRIIGEEKEHIRWLTRFRQQG